MRSRAACLTVFIFSLATAALATSAQVSSTSSLEAANPRRTISTPPLGLDLDMAVLNSPRGQEQVRLGRWLFFDPRLSADGSVSCATCHLPEHAFSVADARGTGIGGQRTARKPPALVGLAASLYPWVFRDGRSKSLEEQVLHPVENAVEMGNTAANLVTTLMKIREYGPYFAASFGTPGITAGRVAQAIAAYERTRVSGNSPWDRWRRNGDQSAVSEQVKRGHDLFFGKARCNQCHFGATFTDASFHNLGVGWDDRTRSFADVGRSAVTKEPLDTGAFRTPTLRDVTKHAPYMHDGSLGTLRDVIALYNRGGNRNPHLDSRLQPLHLVDEEIDALIAFLRALDGEGYQDRAPALFPN
jgi:cytochrome c peroxidase